MGWAIRTHWGAPKRGVKSYHIEPARTEDHAYRMAERLLTLPCRPGQHPIYRVDVINESGEIVAKVRLPE